MWLMEIGFKYSNVITKLTFDTQEEAEKNRDIITEEIKKDRFSNECRKTVRVSDIHGSVDVVLEEVKVVRVFNSDTWSDMAAKETLRNKKVWSENGLNPDDVK